MDTLQRSLSESCFTDEDEEIGLVPRDSQIPSSTASRFYERESTETFKQFHIYCTQVIKTHSWLQTNIEYLSPVLVVIQIWYAASRIICLTTQRNQNIKGFSYDALNDLGPHILHWNQNPKFWVTWHISETETN